MESFVTGVFPDQTAPPRTGEQEQESAQKLSNRSSRHTDHDREGGSAFAGVPLCLLEGQAQLPLALEFL